jgi:hypothetical protein
MTVDMEMVFERCTMLLGRIEQKRRGGFWFYDSLKKLS